MGLTLVERIAARHADGLAPDAVIRAGDFVSIRPRHVMTHDNTGAVIPKFKQIGATTIADPAQPVFAIDHDIQNVTPKNLEKYAKIEEFAAEHGIDFYPAGTGISHQVMVEQGYVVPGALVVASDSHSNLYGGAAALGTPVVRTDAASIWATGGPWWQVPKVPKESLGLQQCRHRCVVEESQRVERRRRRGLRDRARARSSHSRSACLRSERGEDDGFATGNGAKTRRDSEGVFVVVRERAL